MCGQVRGYLELLNDLGQTQLSALNPDIPLLIISGCFNTHGQLRRPLRTVDGMGLGAEEGVART